MKKIIIALTIALSSTAAMAANYSCIGTEPFWGLKMVGSKMIFASPELERPTISSIDSKRSAAGVGPEFAFVVKSGKTTATVVTGACTDGMSDTEYTHHIVVDRGNESVLYGCCNELK